MRKRPTNKKGSAKLLMKQLPAKSEVTHNGSVTYNRIQDTVGMTREEGVFYVVSYGGGVDSTAMIIFIIKNGLPLDYVVFSDTGDEMPETYEYLEVMRKYLKKRNIPFVIVKVRNNTSLSDRCLKRKVVPSQIWR